MMVYVIAIFCVVTLAVGQILFKISSSLLTQSGSFFAFKTAAMLFTALSIYAIASIAWVLVLQKVELSRVYPLLALTFMIVPIFSYFFLGERINLNTLLGSGLIVIGVWISLYHKTI